MVGRDGCCGGVPSVNPSTVENAVHAYGTWLHMHGQDDDGSNPGQLQALQQARLQEASVPLPQSQQDQGRLVV